MYPLFSTVIKSNEIVQPPEFTYIKKGLQRNLLKIKHYYQDNFFYIKSNHLLARILNNFHIPIDYDLSQFINVCYVRTPYISEYYKLTSPLNKGMMHESIFFSNSKEIIISDDSLFSFYKAEKVWKDLESVKILHHNMTNLESGIPDGLEHHSSEYVVILINLPMLLFQYRCFLLESRDKNNSSNTGFFISKYVLPNMLYSQMDIIIFNRFYNELNGIENDNNKKEFALTINNYDTIINRNVTKLTNRLKNSNLNYDIVLKYLPSVYKQNSYMFNLLPEVTPTNQVYWALLLSKLKVMEYLLTLGGDRGKNNNRTLLNSCSRDLMRLKNNRILESILDDDMYLLVMSKINTLEFLM